MAFDFADEPAGQTRTRAACRMARGSLSVISDWDLPVPVYPVPARSFETECESPTLLLGNPGARGGDEPGYDQEGEACECDCDHFEAPSAEAPDLRPSMSEVYEGSRLGSVA